MVNRTNNPHGVDSAHFRVIFENLFDFSQPTHIQHIREIGPLCLTGSTDETTVFSRHAKSFDVSQVLCQEVPVTTGDNVHQVLGVSAQSFERLEGCLGGDGHTRGLHNGRQGALTAEDET